MRFWLTYLLTALIASAAIEVSVPLLRPPSSCSTPSVTSSPAGHAEVSARPAPAAMTTPGPSLAAVAAPALQPARKPATAGQPAASAPSEAPAPADAPAAAAPAAGGNPWGVTATRASYYTPAGENRGWLAGGLIVEIERRCSSSRGEMAICRVEADGGVGAGPWLIALSDLVTFDQPRAESPPESVALLKQYYGLQGQLDQHVAELKQQAVDANPFAPAYRDAAQRYNAFGDREKRLTVQRDQARGADRMRISDELRAMIPEGARLQRDLDASKAKYQNWKSTHAAIANVDPASDPQVKELKQRLAALDPRIKEIVKQ